MNMRWTTATLMAAGVAVAGCNMDLMLDPPRASDAIAFGYLDTTAAHVPLKWVELRQYAPYLRGARPETVVDDGLFYNSYLQPGGYAMSAFGGNSDLGMFQFNVPRQSTPTRFRIRRPGVQFVGSFRYVPGPERGTAPGGFFLERTETPTERDLLRRLLASARDPGLKARLHRRLEALP